MTTSIDRAPTTTALCLLLTLAGAAFGQEATEGAPGSGGNAIGEAVERAIAALEAGDADAAAAVLEPLREGAPEPVLGLLGAIYVEAGRHLEALEVLEPLTESRGGDPAVLYNAGRAALGLGRTAEAERYLERSVRLERATPAARELGLLRGAQGMLGESYALLRPWALAHPDDTEARLAAALCAVELRRVPEAEELLGDLPQDLPRVRLLWGRVLHLKGDPHGAVATLKPLIEGEPTEIDLDARRSLAESYLAVGEAAAAAAALEGHVGDRPDVALQLAKARYQSGDVEGALEGLVPFAERLVGEEGARLRDARPRLSGEIALEHGRHLVAAGEREAALPYLELATVYRADDKQVWQALGQALAALGRREEAQEALRRFQQVAEQETPSSEREMQYRQELQDPVARQLRIASELIEEGKSQEALALLEREVLISPSDPRPRLAAAATLSRLGRTDEALAAVAAAAALAPDDPDVLYQRGVVQMAARNLEAAEADLRQVLELAPAHTAAMNDLAVLLMVKGERQAARGLLQRVLELRPGDATAQSNLEKLASGG